MPRQVTEIISNYWLRADALRECLGRFFGLDFTVEIGEESYNIKIPRELTQDEWDAINALRVDPRRKKKKKKDNTQ